MFTSVLRPYVASTVLLVPTLFVVRVESVGGQMRGDKECPFVGAMMIILLLIIIISTAVISTAPYRISEGEHTALYQVIRNIQISV